MVEDVNLYQALGRLEGKMDMALEILSKDGKRVSAVEKKLWWQTGVFSAVVAALGFIVHFKFT